MSEKHRASHESHKSNESHGKHNEHLENISREKVHRAHEASKKHSEKLHTAREDVKKHAESSKNLKHEEPIPDELHTFAGHQLLKKDAYKQILKSTQAKLSGPSRSFSKFIHNPKVEAVSEISSKTIARPSGLLGGGLGAFLGSSIVLYMTKHYGFEYNYSFLIVTFCVGFGIGLAFELVIRLFKKAR